MSVRGSHTGVGDLRRHRGGSAVAANSAAIDAARAAGAERILYTSHQAASKHSLFAPQTTHAETEEYLAEQNVPFTALRNGCYTSTLGFYIGEGLETGRLLLPQDGPVSWTAHADLAEAAAVALVENGVLDGLTAPLTATEMLDFQAVARILGDIKGRTVVRVVVDDDEWRATAIERGCPRRLPISRSACFAQRDAASSPSQTRP